MRKKHFVLALQPHEALLPKHGTSWSPLKSYVVLLVLVGLAFSECENTTLAFSTLMTPDNQIVTRTTTNNLASYLNLIELNQTNCSSNTTSYVYDKDGNEINNLTKINESGELSFNHTGLPLAQGIDRKFTFSASSVLSNGTTLSTGNRTIYLLGASTITTGAENMLGETLILAGVALFYIAFRKEKEGV